MWAKIFERVKRVGEYEESDFVLCKKVNLFQFMIYVYNKITEMSNKVKVLMFLAEE